MRAGLLAAMHAYVSGMPSDSRVYLIGLLSVGCVRPTAFLGTHWSVRDPPATQLPVCACDNHQAGPPAAGLAVRFSQCHTATTPTLQY
jgi:hypothetical protein